MSKKQKKDHIDSLAEIFKEDKDKLRCCLALWLNVDNELSATCEGTFKDFSQTIANFLLMYSNYPNGIGIVDEVIKELNKKVKTKE